MIAACLFMVMLYRCEKIDENYDPIPDEIFGTWVYEELSVDNTPIQAFNLTFSFKSEMEGFLEWYWFVDYETEGDLIVAGAAKGNFHINDNILFPDITDFGTRLSNVDSNILPEIEWYNSGDDVWITFDMEDETKFKFELVNGKFIQYSDENGDGDFNDEGEKIVYSKES